MLGAEVTQLLRNEFDSDVTVLHALSDDETIEGGEEFLEEWAAENGLADADLVVDDRDVETAIGDAATDATLVVIGATGRGLLSRLVRGSPVLDILEDVECSVLLAETLASGPCVNVC